MEQARVRFDNAAHRIERLAGTVATIHDQRRRLLWVAGGSFFAGMLLWSFLPGTILRTLPASWHMPEKMAAHIIGEPTVWEAGSRLMQAANPRAWQAIDSAAEMLRGNQDVIEKCRRNAAKIRQSVRCTIRIRQF